MKKVNTAVSQTENQITDMKLYPNPVADVLYISNAIKAASFRIYNMLGKVVLSGTIEDDSINVSTIGKGNYIFEIIQNNESVTKVFIKE